MKMLTKLLAIVALFIGTARFAHADPLNGSLSFTGQYTGSFGPSTITFSGNPVALFAGSGDLASFNGSTGSMTYNYPAGGPTGSPNILFAATYGTNMALVFVVASSTFNSATGGTFVFTGTLSEVQYAGTLNGQTCTTMAPCTITQNTSASLTIRPSGVGTGVYSATILAPTPEPSSLLLLGTGLVGAAGMMTLKRRFV